MLGVFGSAGAVVAVVGLVDVSVVVFVVRSSGLCRILSVNILVVVVGSFG